MKKKGVSKFFYVLFGLSLVFVAWFLLSEHYWTVAKWMTGI